MLELLRGCALNYLTGVGRFEPRCRTIVFSIMVVVIIVTARASIAEAMSRILRLQFVYLAADDVDVTALAITISSNTIKG